MKRLLLATIIIAAAMPSLVIAKGNDKWGDGIPLDMHCPDFNNPNKVEAKVKGELDDIVLPFGTLVCVKASHENTGKQITDGVESLLDLVRNAGIINKKGIPHSVSYYIPYGYFPQYPSPTPTIKEEPSSTPTLTPIPTPTTNPTLTPFPTGSASATIQPSATPLDSPSPTPTSEPTEQESTTPSPTPLNSPTLRSVVLPNTSISQ